MNKIKSSVKMLFACVLTISIILSFATVTYAQDEEQKSDVNDIKIEEPLSFDYEGEPVDLSLQNAIDKALENDENLKISESEIDAAKVGVDEAKTMRAKLNNYNTSIYGSTTQASTIINKNGHGVLLAEYNLELKKKMLERNKLTLKINIQNKYFTLKTSIKKYENAKGITKYAKENLDNVKLKYGMGLASEIELLGAKTLYSKSVADENAAKRQTNLDTIAFNQAIGMPLFTKVNLTDELKVEKYEDLNLNEKINLALENRLEMFMTKNTLELDNLYMKLLKSVYPPNTYKYKKADASAKTAKLYVKFAHDGIIQSVYKNYFNMQSAYEAIDVLDKSERQAQKVYDIAVIKYNTGMAPNSEVTDALNKLNQAQINKQQGYLAYKIAKLSFDQSYGIGLGNDPIQIKTPLTAY